MRKLIPVDFEFKLDEDEESDENELIYTNCKEQNLSEKVKIGDVQLCLTKRKYHKFYDAHLESYDLAIPCGFRSAAIHCHIDKFPNSSIYTDYLNYSVTRDSITENVNFHSKLHIKRKPIPKPRKNIDNDDKSLPTNITANKESANQRLTNIDLEERLSLTLEEIVHIRNVLTNAELESLPFEGHIKEDVEKRRICFLCLKTRFGILGPWGQRCRLCQRTICIKCYTKMKIPNDNFAHIPVLLLSPGLFISPSSVESESDTVSNLWPKSNHTFASEPSSPAIKRDNYEILENSKKSLIQRQIAIKVSPNLNIHSKNNDDDTIPVHSSVDRSKIEQLSTTTRKSSTTNTFGTKHLNRIDHELSIDHLRGRSVVVCHDCRLMVIQIIKSSRLTRANIRNNVISRLTLNLLPAYI